MCRCRACRDAGAAIGAARGRCGAGKSRHRRSGGPLLRVHDPAHSRRTVYVVRARRTTRATASYGSIVNPGVAKAPDGLIGVRGDPRNPTGLVYREQAGLPRRGEVLLAAPSARLPRGLIARGGRPRRARSSRWPPATTTRVGYGPTTRSRAGVSAPSRRRARSSRWRSASTIRVVCAPTTPSRVGEATVTVRRRYRRGRSGQWPSAPTMDARCGLTPRSRAGVTTVTVSPRRRRGRLSRSSPATAIRAGCGPTAGRGDPRGCARLDGRPSRCAGSSRGPGEFRSDAKSTVPGPV